MTHNMGTLDRGIRVGLALLVGLLYATGDLSGTAALGLGALALVFLLTSAVGMCPLYRLVGLDTRMKGDR